MIEKKTNGCNGSCCENFSFPFSKDQLKMMIDNYESEVPLEIKPKRLILPSATGHTKEELQFIHDMVILIEETDFDAQTNTKIQISQDGWRWNKSEIRLNYSVEEDEYENLISVKALTYTCKHYDKETTLCTQYENRPPVCRNFGACCEYKGCGFKDKKRLQDLAWSEEYNKEVEKMKEDFSKKFGVSSKEIGDHGAYI